MTQFMVDMTDPQLGQIVLDPAAGTGGFLVCALEHIRSNYVKGDADRRVLQSSIRGIEKKPLPHVVEFFTAAAAGSRPMGSPP